MLGIDVLEEMRFSPLVGKRVGLLTNPAGVNRRGESTIDVLRRAPGVRLVALFGPEHGIYGNEQANVPVASRRDPRTGLPVYSLFGRYRKPTPQMLRGIDVLVVDLQDIGTRSYTYVSSMLFSMAACFENNVGVLVLDRPNPLGGLKVDGPPVDPRWKSYVGAFSAPYVHGLTIGEIARMAKDTPGGLSVPGGINVPHAIRMRGRLTVIPMRGWRRSMRWPETGLRWVPPSPSVPDFAAVAGYPMVGLGCFIGGFSHGIGRNHPFRGIFNPRVSNETLARDLQAMHLPGLAFRLIRATDRIGRPTWGVYIQITDWNAWNPTELNFHLMRLACRYDPRNPFATAGRAEAGLFIKHMGSEAFFDALVRDGARVDVEGWFARWRREAAAFQQASRRYWLYQ